MEILNTLDVTKFGSKEMAEKVKTEKLVNGVYLGSIIGTVNGIKVSKVADTNGEFKNKLKGDFYGRSFDGTEFTSSVCILPNIIHDRVLSLLADSDGEVEFGVKVGMKFVEGRSIPYQYTVEPLTQIAVSKPLERLMALIPAGSAPIPQIAAAPATPAPQAAAPAAPAAPATVKPNVSNAKPNTVPAKR